MITNNYIVKSNILSLQSEINRLRAKHGLTALTFPQIGEKPLAVNYNDLKTKLNTLAESPWIDVVDTSSIGTYKVNDLIKFTDIKVVENVITALDGICAYTPCNNNSNNTNKSDKSHRNYITPPGNSVMSYRPATKPG